MNIIRSLGRVIANPCANCGHIGACTSSGPPDTEPYESFGMLVQIKKGKLTISSTADADAKQERRFISIYFLRSRTSSGPPDSLGDFFPLKEKKKILFEGDLLLREQGFG